MNLHKARTQQTIGAVRQVASLHPDNTRREWPLKDIICPAVKFNLAQTSNLLRKLKASSVISPDCKTWSFSDQSLSEPFEFTNYKFQLAFGGLHSVDLPGRWEEDAEWAIVDLDVASYYPALMINLGLYPAQLGKAFLADLIRLRDARLKAKREKDTATNEALKIVINSIYGKLNDKYSPLRSVISAMRVTINGQLMLLMLIEMLYEHGANDLQILSANTDGVTIKVRRAWKERYLPKVIDLWQNATRMELETAEFKKYWRRDINNYMVEKADGKLKVKGAFDGKPPIGGKWDGRIICEAAQQFMKNGTPVLDTIKACKNICSFVFYQRVKNGGHVYHGQSVFVGKTARWYVSNNKNADHIYRRNPANAKHPTGSFARIPNGQNAVLAMDIRDYSWLGLPDDIGYSFYAEQAQALVDSTLPGAKSSPEAPGCDEDSGV